MACNVDKTWTQDLVTVPVTQRVLGTVMGDVFPNHNSTFYYINPTIYYIGTSDPLGEASILGLEATTLHPGCVLSSGSSFIIGFYGFRLIM